MKTGSLFFAATLALFVSVSPAKADFDDLAGLTKRNTLNDLLGRVTYIPVPPQRDLIKLSRIQEELLVYERRMNGEGLPPVFQKAFSVFYGVIRDAIVEERIDDEYGRDILSVHRQLLERTHLWQATRNPDPEFGKEMLRNLLHFVRELDANSRKDSEISLSEKTPLINGYQVWMGELIAWGCECNGLNAGLRSRLEVQLRNLEHYEELYKRDGHLCPNEREHLHKQFLRVTQETFAILRRVY